MKPVPILEEIIQSIKQVDGFGSVEIYVQDHVVTQITLRKIKKTHSKLSSRSAIKKKTLDKPISLY